MNPWSPRRVPVESVSIQGRGVDSAFVPAVRSADNYFLLTGDGPYQLPLPIIVTSILGDTVYDVVHASDPSTTALIRGSAQFPFHADLGVVGEVPARAASPSPTPAAPVPSQRRSPAPKPAPPAVSKPKAKPGPRQKPTAHSSGTCKRPLQPFGTYSALTVGACATMIAGTA